MHEEEEAEHRHNMQAMFQLPALDFGELLLQSGGGSSQHLRGGQQLQHLQTIIVLLLLTAGQLHKGMTHRHDRLDKGVVKGNLCLLASWRGVF